MIADLHVHTQFSCDSDAVMEDYCKRAISKGVSCICFTDHVDFNRNDDFGYYNADRFFNEYNRLREIYKNDIRILSGIEFSEPHLYRKELEELSKYPYDFIIGSIHWVGDLFPSKNVRDKYSSKEFYKMYWREVFEAVSFGHFDCVGHIDFPFRFYGELVYDQDYIVKIFNMMIHNGIALEINTSSLRKGLDMAMPDMDLLQLYKSCGGCKVTIGSDAHNVEDLAADNQYAKDLINKNSLQEVYFQNHLTENVTE